MWQKALWPTMAVVLSVATMVWAAGPVPGTGSKPPTNQLEKKSKKTTNANLEALHDPKSSSYNRHCLKCHRSVLKEATKDPRVLSFHKAMMPYTPGYNPRRGPTNKVCWQCHRYVELRESSAGALRKQVNPALCAMCHGPSGPGPKFYSR